jgi:hypothetical protein
MSKGKDKINIELSPSEAIVLFEFVSRFSQSGELEIEDQAEERVLWDVCSLLESVLAGPFLQNYSDALAKARDAVRDKNT